MKRPNCVDSFNSQKLMKFVGPQTNLQQQTPSYPENVSSQSQAVPFMANVRPPAALTCQNPMGTYYVANTNTFYPSVMTQDIANRMFPQLGLNAWQMAQAAPPPRPQPVFDTSRPPPPPLPTTPAPENPPPPPMSQQDLIDTLISTAPPVSYYRGRGGYGAFGGHGTYRRGFGRFRGGGFNRGTTPSSSTSPPVASQPSTSGLLVKSPSSLNGQALSTTAENAKQHRFNGQAAGNNEGDSKQKNCPIVHKKKRRKPMSERLPTLEWKREDAQRVLELEKEYHAKRGDKAVIIRFPDPKLDYEIVKGFSSSIESVHFQQPAAPRSCIVHLKKGSDVKEVVDELNKTPFGQGMLSAEPKREEFEDEELAVEDIDPYTLYIGNFPNDVNVDEVTAMFHTAKKVDVGYAQKMKLTRYGFARFTNVDDAITAYKINFNATYKSRSMIVRFRRNNRSIGLDGDRKGRKKDDPKQVAAKQVQETNEETAVEEGPENTTYENESEDGEDEMEDTKSGVFDYVNNMTLENWFSDDMYESDDNEEESLPNLTGMIKSEPEDHTRNDFLCSEDDDDDLNPVDKTIQSKNKENPNDSSLNKTGGKDKACDKEQKGSSNETSNTDLRKNKQIPSSRLNGAYCAGSVYWEEIRQKELNEREEKPDIQSLQSPPTLEASPSVSPITTYGLVPMILPKEENEEDSVEEVALSSHMAMDNKGMSDFEKSLEEGDTDNIDAAFESAWNDFEAT